MFIQGKTADLGTGKEKAHMAYSVWKMCSF